MVVFRTTERMGNILLSHVSYNCRHAPSVASIPSIQFSVLPRECEAFATSYDSVFQQDSPVGGKGLYVNGRYLQVVEDAEIGHFQIHAPGRGVTSQGNQSVE